MFCLKANCGNKKPFRRTGCQHVVQLVTEQLLLVLDSWRLFDNDGCIYDVQKRSDSGGFGKTAVTIFPLYFSKHESVCSGLTPTLPLLNNANQQLFSIYLVGKFVFSQSKLLLQFSGQNNLFWYTDAIENSIHLWPWPEHFILTYQLTQG